MNEYTIESKTLLDLVDKFIIIFNRLDDYNKKLIVAFIMDKIIHNKPVFFVNILLRKNPDLDTYIQSISNNIDLNVQYDYKDIGQYVITNNYEFKICYRNNTSLFDDKNNSFDIRKCEPIINDDNFFNSEEIFNYPESYNNYLIVEDKEIEKLLSLPVYEKIILYNLKDRIENKYIILSFNNNNKREKRE